MLYEHQSRIIKEDPKKTGLWLGTGSGKTLIALLLTRGQTLVICPKTQRDDMNWQRECAKNNLDIRLTVMSKEDFRREWQNLKRFDTIIVDEAHTMFGVTPNVRQRNKVTIPRASQLFEALQAFIQRTYPARLYLCTATPIRSPMTVWAACTLLGHTINFYEFRSMFYIRLPMPGREVWSPKSDQTSKDKLANIVRKIGYIGRLEDFFDVPEQVYKTIHVERTSLQKKRIDGLSMEYPDPLVRIGKEHQIENGVLAGDEFSEPEFFDNAKIDTILDLALEFPKMIIFAKYRAQIMQIYDALKEYKRFMLTGDTKDRGEVIREVNEAKECIFIVQAQISSGWEVPDCPVIVFASRTYSYVDYAQAIGRIQRVNNIKKNLYIHLVTRDGVDEAVDECLQDKKDFDETIYENR